MKQIFIKKQEINELEAIFLYTLDSNNYTSKIVYKLYTKEANSNGIDLHHTPDLNTLSNSERYIFDKVNSFLLPLINNTEKDNIKDEYVIPF